MSVSHFGKSVFINCPFDKDYEPILQAILFCLVYLGFTPLLATQAVDSGENRLTKIQSLIESAKYSIHDLSRCISSKKGEYFRLNMPFELGVDYGCRQFSKSTHQEKRFLILEEKRFQTKRALSDLAGCDFEAHDGNFEKAIRKVRNWLFSEAGMSNVPGSAKIAASYTTDFQEWHYERMLAQGFSEEDIQDYPTLELLEAMKKWVEISSVPSLS